MRKIWTLSLIATLVAPAARPAAAESVAPGLSASAAASAPRRLTFAEAVAIASGATPAVEIAGLKQREAQSKLTQSRAALLPQLSGIASASNRTFNIRALGIPFPSIPGVPATPDLVGPVDNVDARFKVTETVFDLSIWAKIRAAGQGVKLSEAERGTTVEAAAHAAALAYLRAARAHARVAARAADADLARQLQTLAEEQAKAGVSPAIDVTRARTEVAAEVGELLVAKNELDRAQIDLARALGLDPALRFDLADTLSGAFGVSAAPAERGAAIAMALEHRPELHAESLRRQRADTERVAIVAERLPRLEAAADYGVSGEHAADAIATREFSLALTLPLLDGFRREGRIAEQTSVVRESEIRERDLRDQATAEVKAALLDIETGLEEQRVASERLELAGQEVTQATDRFENGVAGNIEVINAQSSLLKARDADIDARFATAMARINLARAAGAAQTLR